ncbi:MAG: hypothetical protein ACRD5F_09540 [Candidatus Acidiferrales bacterium]
MDQLRSRFGRIRKIKGSESLFVIGEEAARVYFRYSKVHPGGRTFFGLRQVDLRQLEGHNSHVCFLLDDGSPPLFIPYADFEEVFHNAQPASDGQFKVQLLRHGGATELYVARQGRFNVDGYTGLETLEQSVEAESLREGIGVSHSQVQTLLAGIGHAKGYDVHVPPNDIGKLDWSLTSRFDLRRELPGGFEKVIGILSQIDVAWIKKNHHTIEGLYEVEHCTPVYSGLLRFNDILLTNPKVCRFSIVSNEMRRDVFARHLCRPTFMKSGLQQVCSFLEYSNVVAWHKRARGGESHGSG